MIHQVFLERLILTAPQFGICGALREASIDIGWTTTLIRESRLA